MVSLFIWIWVDPDEVLNWDNRITNPESIPGCQTPIVCYPP